jgi:hypothetical protein
MLTTNSDVSSTAATSHVTPLDISRRSQSSVQHLAGTRKKERVVRTRPPASDWNIITRYEAHQSGSLKPSRRSSRRPVPSVSVASSIPPLVFHRSHSHVQVPLGVTRSPAALHSAKSAPHRHDQTKSAPSLGGVACSILAKKETDSLDTQLDKTLRTWQVSYRCNESKVSLLAKLQEQRRGLESASRRRHQKQNLVSPINKSSMTRVSYEFEEDAYPLLVIDEEEEEESHGLSIGQSPEYIGRR